MRQTFTILMALMLSFTWASAQSIAGKKFYDQLGTTDYAYSYSSLRMGFRITTQLSADDFVIPAGGQTVIGCALTYSTDVASAINVKIYEDNAGWPGNEIRSMEITSWESVEINSNKYSLTGLFPEELKLNEGKYWISAAATADNYPEYWYFNTDETVMGETTKIKKLASFYGQPIENPVWEEVSGVNKNLSFALLRTPDNTDLALSSINNPVSGNLSDAETVSVSISNAGLQTQTSFDLMYQVSSTIDGVLTQLAEVTESISNVSIEGNSNFDYAFNTKADLSSIGTSYSIKTKVILTNDQDLSNNAQYTSVKNYGPLVTMGVDKNVTTCSAVFVDDGGVNNNYTEAIFDTITIYPETEGSRIAIDFTYIDIWNSEIDTWTFYDGNSTDAPVLYQYDRMLGNLPTYVQARNAHGAMTIVLTKGMALNGIYAGWEANINCVVPDAIDFTALSMVIGNPNGFNVIGNPVDIAFECTNAGTDTLSRNVYLVVDNLLVDTLKTNNLIPGEVDTLHFPWIPQVISDDVEIKVFIEKDGQNTNTDNELSEIVSVFNSGILLESFENGLELPFEWESTNGTSFINDYTFSNYATHGINSLSIKGVDTVIMPLMEAGIIDVLRFDAFAQGMGEQNAIQILASKTQQVPWEIVGTAVRNSNDVTAYEIDLSEYANEPYYFAFTHKGASPWSQSKIDYIRGAKLKNYNNDLMAIDLSVPNYAKTDAKSIFETTVKNIGLNAILSTDYTIEIKTIDSVYMIIKGVDLTQGEEVTIETPLSFATADTLDVYFELKLNNEIRVDNNISKTIQVIVSDKYITENETIGISGDVIATNRTSSISETIFYPSDIGAYGNLKGIEFSYEYDYDEGIDTLPATFYMATLTDSLLVDTVGGIGFDPSWIETDSITFTKVYAGLLDIMPGANNSLYIPFDTPFEYNGSENIILLIHKDSLPIGFKYLDIDMAASEHHRFAYGYNNDTLIDTDSIVTRFNGDIDNSAIPNIKWHFENTGAPKFVSEPATNALEFEDYTYEIKADFEGPNPFIIEALKIPEWMTFTSLTDSTATLTATAIDTVGIFEIQLKVSDGVYSDIQNFELTTLGVPVFTTQPNEVLETGVDYTYNLAVNYNGEGVVEFQSQVIPTWLTLVDNGDNTATLSGSTLQAGAHNVTINANANGVTTSQEFVINVDVVPTFSSIENVIIKENTNYTGEIKVNYLGSNALTIVTGENHNNAISLTDNGDGTAVVNGANLAVGTYSIHLVTSTEYFSSELSYELTVGAVPEFISTPITEGSKMSAYIYDIEVAYNGTDALMLSADMPEWLTFTDNGDGTANLTGTPTKDSVYSVSILAAGDYYYAIQTFSITVLTVGVNDNKVNSLSIYPNPANDFVTVSGAKNTIVEIRDITGKLMLTQEIITETKKIDLSDFQNGIYIISTINDKQILSKRLIIE